jgi:NADH-quinone oxidoreductase subunit A
MELSEYLPVLLFLGLATIIAIALLVIGTVIGPSKPSDTKLAPYECGFNAFEDARMKFDVRYYLIAILFIVFDLEIAFVFRGRWSSATRRVRADRDGCVPRLLVIGFIYVWKKGALEWE